MSETATQTRDETYDVAMHKRFPSGAEGRQVVPGQPEQREARLEVNDCDHEHQRCQEV